MSSTELHFHLLPGIDDGPATMDGSLELAAAALTEGTRTIVATPHVHEQYVTDLATLPVRVEELRQALREEGIPLRVLCGGELAHHMVCRLSALELDLIAQGPSHRRWILLEAPLGGIDSSFTEAAAELRAKGFGAVIAHPERALGVSPESWGILMDEVNAGSALQVNAWSVAGLYGETIRDLAVEAISRTPLVAIASDAHGAHRPPSLRLAVGVLWALRVPRPERFVAATPRELIERGLPEVRAAVVA